VWRIIVAVSDPKKSTVPAPYNRRRMDRHLFDIFRLLGVSGYGVKTFLASPLLTSQTEFFLTFHFLTTQRQKIADINQLFTVLV
jgi:hypothetical protein